ncbi:MULTISPECIES: ABC transporter substrate-binding protein [Parafrankia]|uniref:ABC transporter substrate-binding protein n=1 Tax=Parafrankia TaxID=2994362 RepID=UPI000B88FBF5|nr:ABC transporter substrate-binding protein [Parafrankia sp. CH37]MBE3201436.1 ABC transporter substrate-binding protein [Parafrankia sp. CH37]
MKRTRISRPTVPSHREARHRTRVRLAAVAALSASLFTVAACGSGDDDSSTTATSGAGTANASDVLGPSAPAKGDPVRIGIISDGKGPVSDLAYESRVADATIAYLNEHHSGIAGRPISLVKCETLADPGKGTDCANRMVEEDVVAVVVGSSSVGESIWEPLHQAKIPLMFANTTATGPLKDSDTTFNLTDPYFGQINLPADKAKEAGVRKVTAVVIDVPTATAFYKSIAPRMFREKGLTLDVVAVPAGTADMTAQMQDIASGEPGVVSIIGGDSFCISALNGLRAVGYDGPTVAIGLCITDATRKAVPASTLRGMSVSATAPVGTDNSSTGLLQAVVSTYGHDIDVRRAGTMSMFTVVAAFGAAVEKLTGDVTAASVTAAIKAMPAQELPGAEGLSFRCNGKAYPEQPAVCVRGGLVATLDDKGQPAGYTPVGVSAIED